MATLNQYLDGLRHYMKEARLVRQWNELKAIAVTPVGVNVTLSGGRTMLGDLDLLDPADLDASVDDRAGQAIPPPTFTPDPGKDRQSEQYPQGVDFRF